MVKPKDAAEVIGVSPMNLIVAKKYKKFYTMATKGNHDAMFDLQGYLDYEAEKSDMTSKVLLLVEYIIHEVGVRLRDLAKMCNVNEQQLHSHELGWDKIKRIVCRIHILKPEYIRSFDEYYEW